MRKTVIHNLSTAYPQEFTKKEKVSSIPPLKRKKALKKVREVSKAITIRDRIKYLDELLFSLRSKKDKIYIHNLLTSLRSLP